MYLISGCLLGHNCKYNGGNNYHQEVCDFYKTHRCFIVCPEEASGLPVPRPPAEYDGQRIIDRDGNDVTEAFTRGAALSLERALTESRQRNEEIEGAILKANSPSCGSGRIYDGTFSKNLTDGYGCFAALLREKGIRIISEKEIKDGKF